MTAGVHCPVCQSTTILPWGVSRTGWPLYRCPSCTHRFAALRETVANDNAEAFRIRMTHDRTVSDQNYYRHLVSGEQSGQQAWMTTCLILAQVSNPGTWLDIGCGSGFLLQTLAKKGFAAVGIEPGEWGQIAAREKNIIVTKGFLTKTTFSHPFDYVSAIDVLEHVASPLELLSLVRHYLSSNGRAFLSFPCADIFPTRFLGRRWNMVDPPSHCQFFSRASFRRLCGMAQLEIGSMRRFGMHWLPGALRKPWILDWLNRTALPRLLGDQLLVTATPSGRLVQ